MGPSDAIASIGSPRAPWMRRSAVAAPGRRRGGTLLALLALYACWGGAIPAMKLMVATAPPLGAAGIVFTLGGVVLFATGAARGPRPSRAQVGRAALAGAVMLVGGQGLATVALTRLTASLTAVIAATIPLWVVILSRLRGTAIGRGSALRIGAGFAGILVVVLTAPSTAIGGSPWALAAACAAPVLWAAGTLLAARGDAMPQTPATSGGIQLLVGGAALLCLAAVTGQLDPGAWSHVSGQSIGSAAALLVLDSLAGFTLYTRLLRIAPAPLVSTYAYVTPLVAILIGAVAFGETLWAGAVFGAVIVLGTVALELRVR
jgi:drug/metabolite transporter (DMT)-like permease